MSPSFSSASTTPHYPRILLADAYVSTVESLIHRIKDERLEFDYDVCFSPVRASRVLPHFHGRLS